MKNKRFQRSFGGDCAVSSVGRALPRHGRGHKFKSCTAHQFTSCLKSHGDVVRNGGKGRDREEKARNQGLVRENRLLRIC